MDVFRNTHATQPIMKVSSFVFNFPIHFSSKFLHVDLKQVYFLGKA